MFILPSKIPKINQTENENKSKDSIFNFLIFIKKINY